MNTTKECNICFKQKELLEFYPNKAMKDGFQNRCKDCTKEKTRQKHLLIKSDPILAEKEKERHRLKYHRLNYKNLYMPSGDSKKKAMKNYKEKYPEKVNARNLSSHLKPLVKGNNLHHWSYLEEHAKDVIEMTQEQHSCLHRFIVYDQERMMYRVAKTGELLDTKDSHLQFIKSILN